MNKLIGIFFSALALLLFSSFEQPSSDAQDIQSIAPGFAAAWSRHDAKALAAYWATDGDLLSPWTELIKGREEIEKHFADEFLDKMRDSTLQLTINNVRMIDPETALLDSDFVISGMSIGGVKADPFSDHAIFLLVKREGKWLILDARPY